MNNGVTKKDDHVASQMMDISTYSFFKEAERWYIHLPGYAEQGFHKDDLELVRGAGQLLNTFANGQTKLSLRLSQAPFEDADALELIAHSPVPGGGAIYLLETCHGRNVSRFIWICDIALFVFGDLPEHIYLQCLQAGKISVDQ
jgi:hypothetical protein